MLPRKWPRSLPAACPALTGISVQRDRNPHPTVEHLRSLQGGMSEPTTTTVADKVADKISGALERLVEARMLILGMTLLLYLDIWLIGSSLDPGKMTFDDGLSGMRHVSMRDIALFVASYSLLMSATFPATRYVYVAVATVHGPMRKTSAVRSVEDRQFSNWSLGFVTFAIWDYLAGRLTAGNYHGFVAFLFESLGGNGVAIAIFRVSSVIFFLLCLSFAFEREI